MFIHEYPYTDLHEMNIDWILRRIKGLSQEMKDFIGANKIVYKGEWDNTIPYDAFSVVVYDGKQELHLPIQTIGRKLLNLLHR